MSKKQAFITACFALVFVFLAACQRKSESPTPITTTEPSSLPATSEPLSSAAKEEFDHLNAWDVRAVAIVECPEDYPGFIDSGETRGWIFMREENLRELGVRVHWNCKIKAYEVVPKGQVSSPLCGCPPIQ